MTHFCLVNVLVKHCVSGCMLRVNTFITPVVMVQHGDRTVMPKKTDLANIPTCCQKQCYD